MELIRINDRLAIPLGAVRFSAARSGGPGGQHVNTTSSKVTLHFSLMDSDLLSDSEKAIIARKLAGRINSAGVLSVSCEEHRSWHRNRQMVIERFAALLANALVRPKVRRPTRATRGSKERRLKAKRAKSAIKKGRQWRAGKHDE